LPDLARTYTAANIAAFKKKREKKQSEDQLSWKIRHMSEATLPIFSL